MRWLEQSYDLLLYGGLIVYLLSRGNERGAFLFVLVLIWFELRRISRREQ